MSTTSQATSESNTVSLADGRYRLTDEDEQFFVMVQSDMVHFSWRKPVPVSEVLSWGATLKPVVSFSQNGVAFDVVAP